MHIQTHGTPTSTEVPARDRSHFRISQKNAKELDNARQGNGCRELRRTPALREAPACSTNDYSKKQFSCWRIWSATSFNDSLNLDIAPGRCSIPIAWTNSSSFRKPRNGLPPWLRN